MSVQWALETGHSVLSLCYSSFFTAERGYCFSFYGDQYIAYIIYGGFSLSVLSNCVSNNSDLAVLLWLSFKWKNSLIVSNFINVIFLFTSATKLIFTAVLF